METRISKHDTKFYQTNAFEDSCCHESVRISRFACLKGILLNERNIICCYFDHAKATKCRFSDRLKFCSMDIKHLNQRIILSETDSNSYPFDRRSGIDRRSRPSVPPLFSSYRRRRSAGRRRNDQPGYVDIYGLRSWIIVL